VSGGSASLVDYPLAAFAFSVCIDKGTDPTDAAFREVSGISTEMQIESLAEGGENRFVHQLPKGNKQGKLSLKRGIVAKNSQLVAWCKQVLEGGLGDGAKALIVPKQVLVSLLDADLNPVRTWTFTNAYPVRWELEALNATKNEVAVERIDLAYQYATLTGG
jgi:phage tail-like protein